MDPAKQLKEMLKQDGAELLRHKKHLVYRLSNGQNFVVPSTCSDHRGLLNAVKDLEKRLGLRAVATDRQTMQAHTPKRYPQQRHARHTQTFHISSTAGRSMQSELGKLLAHA